MPDLSRRHLLMSGGALAASLPLSGFAADIKRTLDFSKPEDNLIGMIKMRGSLEAEDVPYWYRGTMYGVQPGKTPIPLVDFEGSEIDYYERQPDGSFFAWAKTVSFFRDTKTDELLETFENPITGETNDVKPNTINIGNAHYIYSVNGLKISIDPRPLGTEPIIQNYLKWAELGDQVWLEMSRPYPDGVPMAEHQMTSGSLSELHDPDSPKVYTSGAPSFISPWPAWMNMGEQPGHVIWVGPSRKVDSIEDYPRRLIDLVEKHHPDRLTAKPA